MAEKVKAGQVVGGLLVVGGLTTIIYALTRKVEAKPRTVRITLENFPWHPDAISASGGPLYKWGAILFWKIGKDPDETTNEFKVVSGLKLQESAIFEGLPSEYTPPFPFEITVKQDASDDPDDEDWHEIYYVQSIDPEYTNYKPVWIPDFGSYYFNVATELFERV